MKYITTRWFTMLTAVALASACGGPVIVSNHDGGDAFDTAGDHAADVLQPDTPDVPMLVDARDIQDVPRDVPADGTDVSIDTPADIATDHSTDVIVDAGCPSGSTLCGDLCVNLQSDPLHCGICEHVCVLPNAVASCTAGVCTIGDCLPGYADCNGNPSDGCEVDLRTDGNHCGSCATACMLPNATSACVAGLCTEGPCTPGFGDCNGNPADGCEASLTSSANCGTCGTACVTPHGTPVCTTGSCGIDSCDPGWGNCDGEVFNGCETDLTTSTANCGTCGTACMSAPNASATCVASVCGFTCIAGFGNCDANAANGCETDTRSDANNCGACGTVCSFPHASSYCSAGVCARLACDLGWVDCNGIAADGCEVYVNSDVMNCGACGYVCPTGNACVGRRCVLPSTGSEGAFAPTADVMLSAGIHNFTTITIPAGVRVTTGGAGFLDLRAMGVVIINGDIDVSGGNGGDGFVAGDYGGGGGGGTGNLVAGTTGGMVCAGGGTGGIGVAGASGGDNGMYCGGAGGVYGGGAGGAWGAAGGGGGGFAGGAGGAGASGAMGGAGASALGAMGGASGMGGGAGGVAPGVYAGGNGSPVSGVCGGATNGYGGGGGAIGLIAANDLNASTAFQPGSAGGGGGSEQNNPAHSLGAGGGGGGGGGLLRIVTRGSVTVGGRVLANGGNGGNGRNGSGGGGGGSGGLIDLAAPTLTVTSSAVISAAGGVGGSSGTCGVSGGAGGLGRIRLVVTPGMCSVAGTFVPALNNRCTPTPNASATGLAYVTTF